MIRVIHQGLGPIGRETARLVLQDKNLQIVGAIDPKYAGKDVGYLLGIKSLGIEITDNAEDLFKETKPDVLVLTTVSELDQIIPSIELAVTNGINIVSPSEELFYPQFVDKEKAEYLDKLASEYNVSILGRGVNPGCLMDTYPLHVFRNHFTELGSMKVYRWDNTIERREPLLLKTGAGLTPEEFDQLNKQGKLGHVGLRMSGAFLADNIGLKDYEIVFSRKPVIAEEAIKPAHGKEIAKGYVTGLHETCDILIGGEKKISLDLRMFVGAENKNSVEISGRKIDYSNIVNGDIATTRILKDMISFVVRGPAGLNRVDYIPNPNKLLGNPNNPAPSGL